jgi:hypothetical protein
MSFILGVAPKPSEVPQHYVAHIQAAATTTNPVERLYHASAATAIAGSTATLVSRATALYEVPLQKAASEIDRAIAFYETARANLEDGLKGIFKEPEVAATNIQLALGGTDSAGVCTALYYTPEHFGAVLRPFGNDIARQKLVHDLGFGTRYIKDANIRASEVERRPARSPDMAQGLEMATALRQMAPTANTLPPTTLAAITRTDLAAATIPAQVRQQLAVYLDIRDIASSSSAKPGSQVPETPPVRLGKSVEAFVAINEAASSITATVTRLPLERDIVQAIDSARRTVAADLTDLARTILAAPNLAAEAEAALGPKGAALLAHFANSSPTNLCARFEQYAPEMEPNLGMEAD